MVTDAESYVYVRWPDLPPFRIGAHDLETAALIARVPRPAVKQYILLAEAARSYSLDDYEDKDGDEDMGAGAIHRDLATVVEESAEVITQLAWNPWVSRAKYRKSLKDLREKAASIDDRSVKRNIAYAHALGRAASPLGELFDEQFTKK